VRLVIDAEPQCELLGSVTEIPSVVAKGVRLAPDRIDLGGTFVDLRTLDEAVDTIVTRARAAEPVPLGVISANLDHIHHFGHQGRWHGTLEQAAGGGGIQWLSLLDGAPLVNQAKRLTGRSWQRLAGSDLIDPLLDAAEAQGVRVGFLGGSPETQELLLKSLAKTRPHLKVTGMWAPSREVITDPSASDALAGQIRAAGVDMLVIGLGKPRQELWIARHGQATGAGVLLAFGAVVDFLAGQIDRAPKWMSEAGFEWSYRLLREPRRLARRYLLDGPIAYVRLRRHSSAKTARADVHEPPGKDRTHDVTAVIVTYNNRDSIGALLADLERESADLKIRIVVVDNDSRDGTFEVVAGYPNVVAVRGGGNLGYAGGINAARPHLGDTSAILVLNPDLRLDPGAVKALWRRLALPGVGISVPKILDEDGKTYLSLRFEPAVLRGLGEAVVGGRLAGRPDWLSEIDRSSESYRFPHAVDWATGACLMVRRDVAETVGDWDERFFLYSEETDYMRRVREAGWNVWFEPSAVVRHEGGGSGQSPQLVALLAVNRVRYAEVYHGRWYAAATRAVTLLGEVARAGLSEGHRTAARYLLSRSRWKTLPAATYTTMPGNEPPAPWGAVIIPAHNEEAVIRSTLAPLQPIAAAGQIELVVAVNGSTDRTAAYAGAFSGVRVLDLERPSKIAALNAADAEVGSGPRLYLDADITITPGAVRDVLAVLRHGERSAARPPFRYDTTGATWPVRAYYRARERLPSIRRHLWGAGVYGLSEAGRSRFGPFPEILADDLYVDSLFSADEKLVVDTDPVIVRTPRTTAGLLAVLRRTYHGNRGIASEFSHLAGRQQSSSQTFSELLSSVGGPADLADAAVYAGLAIAARLQSRQPTRWERDETSRRPDVIDAGGVGNDVR